jgi:hypothetical protein
VFQNTEAARVNIWVCTELMLSESLLPVLDIYLKVGPLGAGCDHLNASQTSYAGYGPAVENISTMKRFLFNSTIGLFSIG